MSRYASRIRSMECMKSDKDERKRDENIKCWREKFVLPSFVIMSFLTLSINESDLHEVPVMQANERVPVVQAHAMPVNEGSSVIGN